MELWLLFFLLIKFTNSSKNVLFIVVDDLRPSLGCFGDTEAVTPNIDKLASKSMLFHRAYAQQALCAPSRNSMLTSRRPDTLHLYDFYNYWRYFSGNFTTLPQYFKESNYHVVSLGKVFHPGKSSNYTDDYPLSWSEEPWHPPTDVYTNSPVCHDVNGWCSNIVCPVTLQEQPGGTLPDIQTIEKAKNFIKIQSGNTKNFFLAVGLHKPHVPLKFPQEYLDYFPLDKIKLPKLRNYPPGLPEIAWNPWNDLRRRHDIGMLNITYPFESISDDMAKLIIQAYYASVTYIDDLIGQLLNELEVRQLSDDTIVVLVGDHGWSLGEHGEWAKFSNYDIAVNVPLMIHVPHLTEERTDSKQLVELVDLFPTLVELLNFGALPICPPDSSDVSLCTEGVSLLPLILDKGAEKTSHWKRAVFSQYPRPGLFPTVKPNSDEPKLKEIRYMGYSMKTTQYRYTEWVRWNYTTLTAEWDFVVGVELYDHYIDPSEGLNLVGRPGLEPLQLILSDQLRAGWREALPNPITSKSN